MGASFTVIQSGFPLSKEEDDRAHRLLGTQLVRNRLAYYCLRRQEQFPLSRIRLHTIDNGAVKELTSLLSCIKQQKP